MEETPGRLTLVATPIGNLGDLSPRVIETLTAADAWLVEDSRISGKLAMHLGLRKPMWVLNDHTTEDKVARYAQEIAAGQHFALLTDGGAPAVSDPGAHLADLCHDGGVIVDAIPGPSAPTLAITLSGFYAQRYAFLGFLPRKPGPMKKEFEPFRDSAYTLVAFESQFRIADLLTAAAEVLGDRRYAVCREMTKAFQQVFRARLPHIPTEAEVPRKGEFTIVFEGKRRSDAD
jgi:16S rRNA (cytidine1402-2'-O)-methyltransferase